MKSPFKKLFNNLSFLPFGFAQDKLRQESHSFLTIFSFILFSVSIFSQEKKHPDSYRDTTKIKKLEEVIVKAVRVSATSPITHSNISKKELSKRNLGQDIPILMNFLPSVVTTSDAGAGVGYTGIRVRGVSAQSTNITINGIPYNDAESLGTFWVDLPDFASSVENLQLQRGVGSSTNGAGAFGASLNLLTDAISEKANGEISNSFGSFNTRKHTLKFSTGKLNNSTERSRSIEIAGRFSRIKSDGYIDRATSDLNSYFLQASYVDDNTLIKGLVFGGHEITYQAWNGVSQGQIDTFGRTYNPSGEYTDENGITQFYDNEVDNYKQDHYQLHWNERFNNHWSTNIGLNYTYGRGFFEQYKENQNFDDYDFSEIVIGGETINTTDLIRRRWLDNDFYVVNANATYKKDDLNIIFGGSYSNYKGDHFGEVIWVQFAGNSEIRDRYYDSKSDKTDFSLFAKTTYKINDNISLFGDIQLRLVDYKTNGLTSDRKLINVDESYSFFNPKAGITYTLNTFNHLYFSYARANREPNRTDFENGNPKPERLNDFELGWRLRKNKLQFSANIYYMKYQDQLILTGEIDDVGSPIRENSGKSYRLGIEVDAAIQLSNKFSLRPNITLSSNKNIDFISSIDGVFVNLGNTNISFSPTIVAANQLQFNPTTQLQISLLSKYVGEQYLGNVDSDFSKLEAYFVNDISVNYEIKTKSIFKSIIITGLINNIFNKKYISNGYYFTYDDTFTNPGTITTIEGAGYYPQATTNFLVGVSLKF
ncbi:MAG: TonB-dependent receptor [Flavobacteriaceae bacterium]|nr:TonB-dependent receptor [Flavobacteriaceae bacterium]